MSKRRVIISIRLTVLTSLLAALSQFVSTANSQSSPSQIQPPWQESLAAAAKGTRIQIPKILLSEARANSKGCSELAPDSHVRFDAYELRAKSGKLVVLWGRSSCFCGATGNCDFWVYHLHHGTGDLLLQADLVNNFGFLKATTNGLPDLVTWTHDSGQRSPGRLWKFNGSNYVVQCSWEIVRSFEDRPKGPARMIEQHVEGNSCEGYDEHGKRVTKN